MITNLTAHTVKVTKKEAKTASVALTRRGAAKMYATLDGSEASASVNENVRVTRGQQNRKLTEKYAEFQKDKATAVKVAKTGQAANAPVEESSCTGAKRQGKRDEKNVEAGQDSQYDQQTGLENAKLLALCQQKSSSPQKRADEQDNEQASPGGPLGETANSSPDKAQLGHELNLILQKSNDRLSKSKQLAQNALKLTSQRSSVTLLPNSLMPKRIMSKGKSGKKTEQPAEQNQKSVQYPEVKDNEDSVEIEVEENKAKAPKDRSALVGLKRTRKSRDQIYQLQKLYEDSKGKPTKAQLKNLAKESGLKLQQVYKWYWDTEKKNNKLKSVLEKDERNIRSPQRISRKIMKTQYTDEFGGYSKTWFADGLDQVKNSE